MRNFLLYSAILTLVLSYVLVPFVADDRLWMKLPYFLLSVAVILFGEYTTKRYAGFSTVRKILSNKFHLFSYIFASTIAAFVLDGSLGWVYKLWYYPGLTNIKYLLLFIPGFAFYWLSIVESYLVVKVLIDKYRKGTGGKSHEPTHLFEKYFFRPLGVVGVISFSLSLVFMLRLVSGEFMWANSVPFTFQSPGSNLLEIVLLFIGVWFMFEFLCFKENKSSLLRTVLRKQYDSLYAVLISAFIFALLMELQNIPLGLWRYQNIPFDTVAFFGLPVLLFLAWPLHYVAFLSIYKFVSGDQTDKLFNGDKIS